MQIYKKLNDVITEHPEIKKFSKIYQNKRFEPIGFVIYSTPVAVYGKANNDRFQIIGLWVFDKDRIRQSKRGQICQDFISYDIKTKEYTYYSGGSENFLLKDSNHKSISTFCGKFGKNINGEWKQYGCSSSRRTHDHRHDINDGKLPKQAWVQKLVSEGLKKLNN